MPSGHSSSSHSSFGGGSFSSSPSFHSTSSHLYSSSSYHSHSNLSSSKPSSSHSKPQSNFEYEQDAKLTRQLHNRELHADDDIDINRALLYYYILNNNRRIAYYTNDYTDKKGVHYTRGYYDETTGKRYDNIIMDDTTNVVTCPYCQKRFLHEWDYDDYDEIDETDETKITATVECPFCNQDIVINEAVSGSNIRCVKKLTKEEGRRQFIRSIKSFGYGFVNSIPIILACIVGFGILIITMILTSTPIDGWLSDDTSSSAYTTNVSVPDVIYVEPLGRECSWDGENYYDSITDSYFWFNTDISPAQWQYWFEGISNEYGDYGWMEYDSNEQQWYIETYSGNWVRYQGDASILWHFEDAHQNPETMAQVTDASQFDYITVQDTVEYVSLTPNETYALTVRVVNDDTDETVAISQTTVTPTESDGSIVVDIDIPTNVENYRFVETISIIN